MKTDLRELLREAANHLAVFTPSHAELIERINDALAGLAPESVGYIAEPGFVKWIDEKSCPSVGTKLYIAPLLASPSDARDAARYRWLRMKMSAGSSRTARIEVWQSVDNPKCIHLEFDALDEAIDAAIEQEGRPNG